MPWYKRLRWRLIASQFLVAFVGVSMMMLATRLIILGTAPDVIRPQLMSLLEDPAQITQIEENLIYAFRDAVLASVAAAAAAAITAGVFSSYLLWRTLIAPLRQMADSSRRVADGRYAERVIVPENSGEAMAQLVVSFNQMAATLEQIEQQRVNLLGNIAHELRTPLTSLKGYLEGLMDGLFPANEETFAWMTQETERLRRLVDDLQNLSRIEAGQFNLDFQPFDLMGVVNRVVAQLRPQAQAKELTLTLEAHLAHVHADADRTAQVLFNLIGNAIRYTPEKGAITITLASEERFVRVVVQDTGIGIPAEALPYVFERFYRVDQSRARVSGGSGIGLTIARHLVWAMGGEIAAASQGPDQGSRFTFTLPLIP
ncbi:MAG: HAMP domain-containing protein [Chloroflexi bacterium]|nr:HAMP domain-containing protein [Chloroflexota bacterium]MBP8058274.1 HAMP domain-containing protein [Chloroflexota bacterium]